MGRKSPLRRRCERSSCCSPNRFKAVLLIHHVGEVNLEEVGERIMQLAEEIGNLKQDIDDRAKDVSGFP
jgi:hypothetical protein